MAWARLRPCELSDTASVRRPPTRRYQGFFADSARWERFALRPDDIVITTPSKCGTTWMQHIVGMLVLDVVIDFVLDGVHTMAHGSTSPLL